MKSLSKSDRAKHKEFLDTLCEKRDLAEQAIEALNDVIEEANEFRSDIVSQMDDYIGDRSEKWPESESGQTYTQWHDEWEQAELESVDALTFDETSFENLPLSVNEL